MLFTTKRHHTAGFSSETLWLSSVKTEKVSDTNGIIFTSGKKNSKYFTAKVALTGPSNPWQANLIILRVGYSR